jgi:hypothetical protein
MTNVFLLENTTDFTEKLNIDELFEKKQKHDLNTLALYNKLLNRIHVRIKTTARQKMDEQYCWFMVPEVMIGVPKYDQAACINYVMEKLTSNKFNVRYIHPNTLFISWIHWVPTYVRNEIKSKTGVILDEFGREKEPEKSETAVASSMEGLANSTKAPSKNAKLFTPIQKYKPQGNLVYNDELLEKLDNKIN